MAYENTEAEMYSEFESMIEDLELEAFEKDSCPYPFNEEEEMDRKTQEEYCRHLEEERLEIMSK
ncbi:hypothetical protein NG767_10765 [Aliarcobacter cryaerophilus]|uniref:hypothetical protein n=1 Tax=Aliarcobacter cryaerophilus TaxID=28198 RepID=UPI003DA44710